MLNFSQNLGKSLLVIALTSGAVLAYSELESTSSDAVSVTQAIVQTQSVKVENISMDYARAHLELMKLPDEAPVKAF
ncbi:MAG: hypothetical protein ACKO0Z_08990 [Betaproteobacteria bacterium]